MGSHDEHHFIPKFILRQWESGSDGKLTAFGWKGDGRLHADRLKAKSVGSMKNVYSIETLGPANRNTLEKGYFSSLDNEAAKMHRELLGLREDFHPQDRSLWAQFVLALEHRTPWRIDELAASAPDRIAEEVARNREAGEFVPEEDDVRETPGYYRDLTLIAMQKALDGHAAQLLADAQWTPLDLRHSRRTLLIGDQAVLRRGALDTSDFVVFLPLAPRVAHLIADPTNTARIRAMEPSDVVTRANTEMLARARQYVYATDDSQGLFVERRLRKPSKDGQ